MKEARAYAVMFAVVALALGGYTAIRQTANVAHKLCQRSMTISPELAAAYERYHILTPSALALYKRTIPKSCLELPASKL